MSAPDDPPVTAWICGKRWCGEVGRDHDWTGPVVEFPDGGGAAVTCARCGLDAMTHTLLTEGG